MGLEGQFVIWPPLQNINFILVKISFLFRFASFGNCKVCHVSKMFKILRTVVLDNSTSGPSTEPGMKRRLKQIEFCQTKSLFKNIMSVCLCDLVAFAKAHCDQSNYLFSCKLPTYSIQSNSTCFM